MDLTESQLTWVNDTSQWVRTYLEPVCLGGRISRCASKSRAIIRVEEGSSAMRRNSRKGWVFGA